MATGLETELAFYEQHKKQYLRKFKHRHVLIKGQKLIGVYDERSAALDVGVERFGMEPFLVKHVEPVEEEFECPALTLGLLHANPEYQPAG